MKKKTIIEKKLRNRGRKFVSVAQQQQKALREKKIRTIYRILPSFTPFPRVGRVEHYLSVSQMQQ